MMLASMSATTPLAQFAGQKYLSLESFRRDGRGVRTPVWFAEERGRLYVYTEAASYKVKRIRNNPRVRVAPCDVRGRVRGPWADATARVLDDAGSRRTHELLNRKYGLLKRVADVAARLRGHERAELVITLD
jgi:PPOX class probable F420-dependent enzyme